MIPRHPPCSYATHPLEPVEVSKTLDDPQAAMYKPSDEQGSVITLECASSALKSSHDIKIESSSLEHSVERGAVSVSGGAAVVSVPTAVVNGAPSVSADTWTPLTPPQSTLQ